MYAGCQIATDRLFTKLGDRARPYAACGRTWGAPAAGPPFGRAYPPCAPAPRAGRLAPRSTSGPSRAQPGRTAPVTAAGRRPPETAGGSADAAPDARSDAPDAAAERTFRSTPARSAAESRDAPVPAAPHGRKPPRWLQARATSPAALPR